MKNTLLEKFFLQKTELKTFRKTKIEQEIVKNCVQLKAEIVCEFLENVFSLNRRLFSKIHVQTFKEISQFVS